MDNIFHTILLALKTSSRAAKYNNYLISRLRMRGDENSRELADYLDYRWSNLLASYAINRFLITIMAVFLGIVGLGFFSMNLTEHGWMGVSMVAIPSGLALLMLGLVVWSVVFGKLVAFRASLRCLRASGITVYPFKNSH